MDILHLFIIYLLLICKFNIIDRLLKEKDAVHPVFIGVWGDGKRAKSTLEFLL